MSEVEEVSSMKIVLFTLMAALSLLSCEEETHLVSMDLELQGYTPDPDDQYPGQPQDLELVVGVNLSRQNDFILNIDYWDSDYDVECKGYTDTNGHYSESFTYDGNCTARVTLSNGESMSRDLFP
jgi:hypothetical protein